MTESLLILDVLSAPIIQFRVNAPKCLGVALRIPGQTAVESFHITLARPDDLGISTSAHAALPSPPIGIGLKSEVQMVRTAEKTSCYVEVDEPGQRLLAAYVRVCEEVLGCQLLDKNRVFHVTLSNAGGGAARASVGAVWEHSPLVV